MFRKKGRSKPEPRPDNSSGSRDPRDLSPAPGEPRSSRSLFILTKSQTRSSTSSAQVENVKGPLGLNLLSSSTSPEVDIIFVHGLGGGSRKTWSKSPSPSHFWPEEWLPKDPSFQNVRIHSYGYDSNYLRGKEDCLNVHHIGKSLLGAISTSPCIINSKTSIILVGHSMGGLVLKKAYILAKQDQAHSPLAGRFAAFFFLATPHRGAGSAKTLKNLLKVAYDRAYVGDLEPNSGAVQVINDGFRHVSGGLELWSFYETQNMSHFGSLIVDPESAVLGYPKENQIPVTADHRSICKFDTPEDPNYVLLRNALASTVESLATISAELVLKQGRASLKDLRKYLDVSEVLDDDFANVCEARMKGSCGWITTKPAYLKWRDGKTANERILWVNGKPATGKSVLTGHVIEQLQESGLACSYFFFKHGDKSKSTMSRCLRSLAFQMARSSPEVSDLVLSMQADGVSLDRLDERNLWRILFQSGILKATKQQHYWVLDALDECSNTMAFFQPILSNMADSVPLRVFITSRDTADLVHGFSVISSRPIQSLPVSTTDTETDISLLVEKKMTTFATVGPSDRRKLAGKILEKSRGSFLWTILVLEELLRCHSRNEIDRILDDVPRGMESLYKRTLESMSQAVRGRDLAKTILMWAACAVRPLTIDELDGALALELQDSFPRLEESITALCGQLVLVDKHKSVKMIHETAREFLVSSNNESEFSIETTKAHTHMARVCLEYLIGDEMKPPRYNRRRSSANRPVNRRSFSEYANTAFSFHLSRADPLATRPFQLLLQFLGHNVLTWIEAMAESRNLTQLIRASKHLKMYTNACAVERSPLDPRIQNLKQWSTDLPRLAAMFSNALNVTPSAIHSLVPPFCPTESMVYQIGASNRRLAVHGALNKQWDDRLLCIDFRQGQARTLRYGNEFLAVGFSSGIVLLYHITSYQEYRVLEHGEAVHFIAFQSKSSHMATCGPKTIKVWDLRSGQVVHKLKSPPRPLGMEFDGQRILIASRNNYVVTWDLAVDPPPPPVQSPWNNTDASETNRKPMRENPYAVALSTSHRMLAAAYNGQPIALWDMQENTYIGSCGKKLPNGKNSTHIVVALAFNPNPDIPLLAVAYLDGDLALLDLYADQQVECFRANCQTLAASPNGRLLAAGGANGVIHVYEFDTFKLLYRVKSHNSYIKQLGFSGSNMIFADIRGAQLTVWEPEALLRETLSDDSSGLTTTTMVETVSLEPKAKITAMVIHHTLGVVFCGKDDGSVVLYSQKTAASVATLYSHKSPVRLLVWIKEREALLSVDASNKIFLYRIQKSPDQEWHNAPTVLFRSYLNSEQAIVDVLVGEQAAKLLISTRDSDHLFNLDSGGYEKHRTYEQSTAFRRWLLHPESPLHLVYIDNTRVSLYSWGDWSEVSSMLLTLDSEQAELREAVIYSFDNRQKVMLNFSTLVGSRIAIIDTTCLIIGNNDNVALQEPRQVEAAMAVNQTVKGKDGEALTATYNSAGSTEMPVLEFDLGVSHIVGIDESLRLIFLNQSFWMCSVDLTQRGLQSTRHDEPPNVEIYEHFFIPYEWFAGKKNIVCVLAKRDVLLTQSGDLAVVKGGLDHAERILMM